MIDDERAVSVALTHALTIGITALLVAGLVMSSGGLLESQRDRAVRGELTVVGERLASEITELDRLADSENSTLSIETSHPDRVADTGYAASLETSHPRCDTNACVVMDSRDTDVTVVVPLRDDIDVDAGATARGGDIRVVHDGSAVTLRGESA